MAQRIEFIKSNDLDVITESFDDLVETFHGDARFIVTPVGILKDGDEYVLAVRVEATHKTTFRESRDSDEE